MYKTIFQTDRQKWFIVIGTLYVFIRVHHYEKMRMQTIDFYDIQTLTFVFVYLKDKSSNAGASGTRLFSYDLNVLVFLGKYATTFPNSIEIELFVGRKQSYHS